MRIAENVLKRSLQNVYFLAGTALAGKTTMSKMLSKKYGFVIFNDNWHEEDFSTWQSIVNEKYQEKSTKRQDITDWESYCGRAVEEFSADNEGYTAGDEYVEFAIIELVKLSQNNKVIAGICLPLKFAGRNFRLQPNRLSVGLA